MKVFLGLIIFFYLIVCTVFIKNFKDFKIVKEGEVVQMKITKLPRGPFSSKTKASMTLDYKGQVFTKNISAQFGREHAIGDMVEMRYLSGVNTVLFPGETGITQFVSMIALMLCFLFLLIYMWVKV